MSLDFYLEGPERDIDCECNGCGNKHTHRETEEFFSKNITHNLGRMASEAGVYMPLWRPTQFVATTEDRERIAAIEADGGWHKAREYERTLRHAKGRDLVDALRKGLADLKARPEHYEQFNAVNGWGLYKHFVPFVEECLAACEEHPDADARACV